MVWVARCSKGGDGKERVGAHTRNSWLTKKMCEALGLEEAMEEG